MPELDHFPHSVGAHCSSTSVQNVLRYDGVGLSEAMVFGLGSGLGFFYLHDPDASPTHRFNGRAADLEGNFYRHVGRPLPWAEQWSPREMAQAIAAGRPVLAQTDIYYLPYYRPQVHFIGHGIVITGIDLQAQTAVVADIADEQPIRLDLAHLHEAMGHEAPPLLQPYRWAAAPPLDASPVTADALRRAIGATCRYMLTPPSPVEGVPAMAVMAAQLPAWAAAPDWAWCARFGYQSIEKRGTGGGGFRHLYADFLAEAEAYLPQLASVDGVARFHTLGEQWSAVAEELKAVFVAEDKARFAAAGQILQAIVAGETAVLQALQAAVAPPG